MNIVDALIQKGSTGGNNIAEAIENLPAGGGGLFIIHSSGVDTTYGSVTIDKTFDEIVEAYKSGLSIFLDVVSPVSPYVFFRLPLTMYNDVNGEVADLSFSDITSIVATPNQQTNTTSVTLEMTSVFINSSGATGIKQVFTFDASST